MRTIHTLTLILLALLVAACGTIASPIAKAPSETGVDVALIERGVQVYLENYCGICHTLTVANTRGTFGPNHDNAGALAAEYIVLDTYRGKASTVDEYIRESILNPAVFYTPGYEATNHHMPAFTHLPDEDIEALVYLLAHQRINGDEDSHGSQSPENRIAYIRGE
jgi:mono/diheme cytochrome c family protein